MKTTALDEIKAAATAKGIDISTLKAQSFLNDDTIDEASLLDTDYIATFDSLDDWAADIRDTVEADNCNHEKAGVEWAICICDEDGEVICSGTAYTTAEDND